MRARGVDAARETEARCCGCLDREGADDGRFPPEGPVDVVEPTVADHVFHCQPSAPEKEPRTHNWPGRDLDFVVAGRSVRPGWMPLGEVPVGDLAHEE